jgi:hypothetical protein
VTGRAEGNHSQGWIPPRIRWDASECEDNSVSTGKRTRWETSWRLEGLFGVAPRFGWKYPEVVFSVAHSLLRGWGGGARGKRERGGRKPYSRAGRPRRGEGQESIGFSGCLTVPGRKRLLNRSKALESGSTPVRVSFAGPKPSLLMPAWASCVTLQGWGRPLVIGLAGSPAGSVTDVGNSPDVA